MTQRWIRWLLVALVCSAFSQLSAAKDFASYTNTNQLVWDKAFKPALVEFFGMRKASFFWENGLIWQQALAGLGGPPDDIEKLSSSLYLASACRAHSCTEKAAAVIEQPSRLLAVGLIEYGCFRAASCSERPTLQLYVRGQNSEAERAIIDWAGAAVGDFETRRTVLK